MNLILSRILVALQIINGAQAAILGLVPLKYAAIAAFIFGVIQAILPRVQGSTATAKGE